MMTARETPHRLTRDERGAIVVFGIFFAVFILGMLYYLIGLANAMYYREHLQDAADAAAFGAAVVHARGMNAIALINMIMAAVLCVLVTLRLIEALIAVAQAIMAVLSVFGGVTAGVASALQTVRQEVSSIADQVEPVVENVLVFLHQAGEVVKVIVPIGSNATVLSNIAQAYDRGLSEDDYILLAVAIPPRLTLPVQDDTFPYLCEKAGVMAGQLALLPLSPILPSFVEDGVSSALGSLVSAGSGWFCGEEGAEPPTVRLDPQVERRPISAEHRTCVEYQRPSDGSEDRGQELCRAAERADMLAEPDPNTGECRQGQNVCVSITEDGGETYVPPQNSYCAGEGRGAVVRAEDCQLDRTTPYGRRLLQARESCRPAGDDVRGYWWIEQTVHVTWTWNASLGSWQREAVADPLESMKHGEDDTTTPCGLGPRDSGWNTGNLERPVCSTERPAPTAPPRAGESTSYQVEHVEVVQVLGCGQHVPGREVQVGSIDLNDSGRDQNGDGNRNQNGGSGDAGGSFNDVNDSNSSNKNPFRFEEGHLLGTSDMQIRSLVLGNSIRNTTPTEDSDRVVAMTRWQTRGEDTSQFLNTAREWGRLSVAQAEYYFDGRRFTADAFADPGNRRDWLWYMGWTARMRRFRLNWEGTRANGETVNADGESQRRDDDQDLLRDFGGAGADQLQPGQAACSGPMESMCRDSESLMQRFDNLFLH